jgi:hypothetical protein
MAGSAWGNCRSRERCSWTAQGLTSSHRHHCIGFALIAKLLDKWPRRDSMPSDVWYIESVLSGKVLIVERYTAGAPVVQLTNLGVASQQWTEIVITGGYKYRNVATGLYFDVSGSSYAAGAPLIQWSGTQGLNQVFARSTTSC